MLPEYLILEITLKFALVATCAPDDCNKALAAGASLTSFEISNQAGQKHRKTSDKSPKKQLENFSGRRFGKLRKLDSRAGQDRQRPFPRSADLTFSNLT
ncbi:MAG: hypothetical protein JOY90_30880 [Bradyrhizobium sp.]|uniref:hypothetical protein n=1 Tax=Bradyrhizobium sp. TaxID=376 RepID=UPI001E071E9F|nr:hypothetical protein [Bradyrhizobium sp.]MBV9564816.1 hypothetical protein [Bradyrhizobium sp.]